MSVGSGTAGDAGGGIQTRAGTNPCTDDAHRTAGMWDETYQWRFNAGTTDPSLGPGEARDAIRRGAYNIGHVYTDCGTFGNVDTSANSAYLGTTSLRANINSEETCLNFDGVNVHDFAFTDGDPTQGYDNWALTCTWTPLFGTIFEADVRYDRGNEFVVLPDSSCYQDPDLTALATQKWDTSSA